MKHISLLLFFCSIICANLGYFISGLNWFNVWVNIGVEICLILSLFYKE
jgi:hypothetical protein